MRSDDGQEKFSCTGGVGEVISAEGPVWASKVLGVPWHEWWCGHTQNSVLVHFCAHMHRVELKQR